MTEHVFVGFGFGPIQAALFAWEAIQSNRFRRIVIGEVDGALVRALREQGGVYAVNVAGENGLSVQWGRGVEIYDLSDPDDRIVVEEALREATDVCTSLPSVDYYDRGSPSVAALIAGAMEGRRASNTLIYTAENNNHAAELLQQRVEAYRGSPCPPSVQFLNTVIGKMCRVVTEEEEIQAKGLTPLVAGMGRAYLVESFNRIYVTRCRLPSFAPGIDTFIEEEDLFPFEEVKLYGHNAVHAWLAFVGHFHGLHTLPEIGRQEAFMRMARQVLVEELGAALRKKYADLTDSIFTEEGFQTYADDLLRRIVNAGLDDSVSRLVRDVERKLGLHDRLFGAMSMCLDQGVVPEQMAMGAAAGVLYYFAEEGLDLGMSCAEVLEPLWKGQASDHVSRLLALTERGKSYLLERHGF